MKYFTLFLLLCLTSCGSKKVTQSMSSSQFEKTEQPYFEEWSGGAPGSGNGVTLYFPASILEGQTMLISRFTYPSTAYNMSADSKEEFGNRVPNYDGIPFELANDKAVIAFEANGKMKYVKLENITQKETVAYPSAPLQGQ
jgi:hypothetical protein